MKRFGLGFFVEPPFFEVILMSVHHVTGPSSPHEMLFTLWVKVNSLFRCRAGFSPPLRLSTCQSSLFYVTLSPRYLTCVSYGRHFLINRSLVPNVLLLRGAVNPPLSQYCPFLFTEPSPPPGTSPICDFSHLSDGNVSVWPFYWDFYSPSFASHTATKKILKLLLWGRLSLRICFFLFRVAAASRPLRTFLIWMANTSFFSTLNLVYGLFLNDVFILKQPIVQDSSPKRLQFS